MPRTCTVCGHDQGHSINVALVQREPYRHIATRYDVSTGALQRHAQDHLPKLLVEAKNAVDSADADDLLGEVRDLHARTLSILEAAEESEELRTALGAIREARGNLELLAKLRQLIDTSPTVNILIAPVVQQTIINALEPYPDARQAVADSLATIEAAS